MDLYPSPALKVARILPEDTLIELPFFAAWSIKPCAVCGSLEVVGMGQHPSEGKMYCAEHNH